MDDNVIDDQSVKLRKMSTSNPLLASSTQSALLHVDITSNNISNSLPSSMEQIKSNFVINRPVQTTYSLSSNMTHCLNIYSNIFVPASIQRKKRYIGQTTTTSSQIKMCTFLDDLKKKSRDGTKPSTSNETRLFSLPNVMKDLNFNQDKSSFKSLLPNGGQPDLKLSFNDGGLTTNTTNRFNCAISFLSRKHNRLSSNTNQTCSKSKSNITTSGPNIVGPCIGSNFNNSTTTGGDTVNPVLINESLNETTSSAMFMNPTNQSSNCQNNKWFDMWLGKSTLMGYCKRQLVAIHLINIPIPPVDREVKKALKLMRDLSHKNLCPFIGACVELNRVCVLWEFNSRGSLQDVLMLNRPKLKPMFIGSLVFDLIHGLTYLHESDLKYHGNLKITNCVVDSRWVLKLSDFGLNAFREGKEKGFNDYILVFRIFKII